MLRDFDSLPIPFRAMATDLVEGKEVILSKGSLALCHEGQYVIACYIQANALRKINIG